MRSVLVVGISVVLADLTSKAFVTAFSPSLPAGGALMPTTNPRFMLGLAGAPHLVATTLMVLGVALAVHVAIRQLGRGNLPAPAAGLTIGGAVANTIDRAVNGAVTDFLVLGPVVLNLADGAVIAGLAWSAATWTNRRRPSTATRGDRPEVHSDIG
jgi:lipoprotein signal peptidase